MDVGQTGSDQEAMATYQSLMDRYCHLLLQNRFDDLADLFAPPYVFNSGNLPVEIESRDQVLDILQHYRANLRDHDSDKITIVTHHATFHTPDLIEGIHETHLTRRGVARIAPYFVRVDLRRSPNTWRISGIEMMLSRDSWPFDGLPYLSAAPEAAEIPRTT